jgi:hypothetical protein
MFPEKEMTKYTPLVDRRGGFRLPISPRRWGAVMWDTLHFVSLGYPERDPAPETRQAALEFMRSLPFLLPCQACREHLADAYETDMPLEKKVFASRQNFGEYIVELRDLVKQKHVCPGCDPKTHSFPEDVASRLLAPPKTKAWLWLIPLCLFFTYRLFWRHGKHVVSSRTQSTSYSSSSRGRFYKN